MYFKSIEELFDFAISREVDSEKFYLNLAKKVNNQAVKKIFENFATEEASHKLKLGEVKKGNLILDLEKDVQNLKIAEYSVIENTNSDGITLQDALIIAMKKEKAAYRLYNKLADIVSDASMKNLLYSLAKEESNHKLKIEILYDDKILIQN